MQDPHKKRAYALIKEQSFPPVTAIEETVVWMQSNPIES